MTLHATQRRFDASPHPCVEKGLSAAHMRVFHAIATGLRHGHDPAIVQDLFAYGLLRAAAGGHSVPEVVIEQLADWIEWTVGDMERQKDGTNPAGARATTNGTVSESRAAAATSCLAANLAA
jgi:hypothetical protein